MRIAVMGSGGLGGVGGVATTMVELGRAEGVPTPLDRAIADILALRAGGAAS